MLNWKSKLILTLLILSFILLIIPSCIQIGPASRFETTPSRTPDITTNIPELTLSPSPLLTSTVIGTAMPRGLFALLIYPPSVINYDVSAWKDESDYPAMSSNAPYEVLNYLQSLSLASCQIGVQGPTGDFPSTPQTIRLDNVTYEVITFDDPASGSTTAYYIENKSITGFNYEAGSPVLVVQASSSEWNECKSSAEEVLATLRVP
jgi:hypothetical protein